MVSWGKLYEQVTRVLGIVVGGGFEWARPSSMVINKLGPLGKCADFCWFDSFVVFGYY